VQRKSPEGFLNAKFAKITKKKKEEVERQRMKTDSIQAYFVLPDANTQNHEPCETKKWAARGGRFASFAIFALKSPSAPSA
jgi:hypothetical protein